jgi:hypothetical protein
VQTVVVNPAEMLDDGELHAGPGGPGAVADQFGLEAVEEALGEGVVRT